MKRNHWLILATVILLGGNLVWHLSKNWGLITIHAENRPLSEIIRSIEKQGGVTLRTDIDGSTAVRMHVDKVKLSEALETLSVLTESRWRLAYLLAPDKGAIINALGTLSGGQRVEGWRMLYLPVPGIGGEHAVLPDPRADAWEVKAPPEATLQAYLQQAAQKVSASFLVPENWNPAIPSPPKSGPIAKALPKLASAANGKYEEVFLLQRGGRFGRGEDGERDGGDGPRFASFDGGGGGGRGPDREAMEERIQAEIAKLPPAERAEAQQMHNEFKALRDLPREEREAKMRDFFTSDAAAERMEKGISARDARRSPQQRLERAHKYLDNKARIKSGEAPTGGKGGGGKPGKGP